MDEADKIIMQIVPVELDIMKHEKLYKKEWYLLKHSTSWKLIWCVEELKRSLLKFNFNWRWENFKLWLCKRYKPLIEFLMKYMQGKGVDTKNKDILI